MRVRRVLAVVTAVLMASLGAVIVLPTAARADDHTCGAGSKLVKMSTGVSVGEVRNHHEYSLAAGDYQIEVANTGDIGGYTINWAE